MVVNFFWQPCWWAWVKVTLLPSGQILLGPSDMYEPFIQLLQIFVRMSIKSCFWTNSILEEFCRKSVFDATKQPYELFSPSVTPFWLCSHHRIIMKFSGAITNDRSDVHAKGQGQRSKVKVTEVKTQLNHFRTVTPVWIHIWWWNDAQSLMVLRRDSLSFFKVIRQISRSYS